jgi:hypothetical protein
MPEEFLVTVGENRLDGRTRRKNIFTEYYVIQYMYTILLHQNYVKLKLASLAWHVHLFPTSILTIIHCTKVRMWDTLSSASR